MDEIRKIDPIIMTGPDFCYVCGKAHVLDIYTEYDRPVGLTALLNYKKNLKEAINIPLKYGRCRNCGTRFKIVWDKNNNVWFTNDKFAVRDFISQFKDFDMEDAENAYFDASTEGLFRD